MKRERVGVMINEKKNKLVWGFLLVCMALGLTWLAQGTEKKTAEENSKAVARSTADKAADKPA